MRRLHRTSLSKEKDLIRRNGSEWRDAEDIDRRLLKAAEAGLTGECSKLRALGADVRATHPYDGTNHEHTALHMAALNGHAGTCGFLVESGASLDARTSSGSSALHCAARNGGADVCAVLIELGADVSAEDINGSTALHLAARSGSPETCSILIRHGARLNKENLLRETPEGLASPEIRSAMLAASAAMESAELEASIPLRGEVAGKRKRL